MNPLSIFARFAKSGNARQLHTDLKTAVIYTRVSGKEQYDKNLSLECQQKAIEEYASRSGMSIAGCFGGTYESAKTDGRKEFQRMLEFIRKNNGKVSHILVFMLDRFSRTGGGAIKLAEELRNKYGVEIYAVAQPTDTSHPSGIFQQNIHFIFSQYDNELRRQRTLTGMREKFSRGLWIAKPPVGYDVVKVNGDRNIVVNDTGQMLRKAFVWKSEGMKNELIRVKLKALGISLSKQHLTKIFKNPFYCGLVCHSMLEGKIVEGTHEKLVSQQLFLAANDIHQSEPGYGVSHKRQQEQLPLKVFTHCSACQAPLTGYIVKAKQLWYYKCRTTGCKCNRSAKELHRIFANFLCRYRIKEKMLEPLLAKLASKWKQLNGENYGLIEGYEKQRTAIKKRMDNIEEGYFVTKEMGKEMYEKFLARYTGDLAEVDKEIAKLKTRVSGTATDGSGTIHVPPHLTSLWETGDIDHKESLQKLIFPKGVTYDKDAKVFKAEQVGAVFEEINTHFI